MTELLEKSAELFHQAERYEMLSEIYRLIIPIYERNRDFKVNNPGSYFSSEMFNLCKQPRIACLLAVLYCSLLFIVVFCYLFLFLPILYSSLLFLICLDCSLPLKSSKELYYVFLNSKELYITCS